MEISTNVQATYPAPKKEEGGKGVAGLRRPGLEPLQDKVQKFRAQVGVIGSCQGKSQESGQYGAINGQLLSPQDGGLEQFTADDVGHKKNGDGRVCGRRH